MHTATASRSLLVTLLATSLSLTASAAPASNDASRSPLLKRLEGLTPGAESPIDLHNGSFHYDVDVDVPDFHGIEPELELSYNSSAGNGFVGVGWRLSGFSVIERVSSRSHGTRRCTADDMYTLDGEPLLTCNARGGTHCVRAGGFQRIQFDAAAERWLVWETDGTRRTYAKIFQVPLGMPHASCPYRYGLVSVEDPRGNTVSYTWFGDIAEGDVHKELYPATVSYNGVTVTFHRELRPDAVSYANGFDWTNQRYRLKSVVVTVDSAGAPNNGTDQLLRVLALGYQTSASGRSLLTSVARYGRDAVLDGSGSVIAGTVLWRKTFSYGGGSVGFAASVGSDRFNDATGWADVSNYSTMRLADLDGDGRMDVCARADNGIHCYRQTGEGWQAFPGILGSPALSDSSSWNLPQYYSTIQFPDLNGDGRADLCARGAAGLHCWYNENDPPTFSREILVPGGHFSDAMGWANEAYYSSIQFPDINGDGKADVCARASTGVFCILQNATGTSWGDLVNGPPLTDAGGWSSPQYRHLQYPDINGDGRADICGRSSEGVTCHLSTGNGFDLGTTWLGPKWTDAAGWGDPKYHSTIQYPDINGDGKADVCGRSSTGMRCHLAIGSARVTGVAKFAFNTIAIVNPIHADANGYWAHQYYSTIQFPDLDGDGRADMCWRSSGGIECDRSNGTSWTRVIIGVPGWSDAMGWNDLSNYATIQFADLNGDGKADLFGRHDGGLAGIFTRSDGPERLHAVTNNGLGGNIRLTYAPSSSFPNTNNPPVEQVVTAIETDDGRGNTSITRYSYSGGQFDRANRRPLGFRYVKRTLPAIPGETSPPFEETWFMQGPYSCVGKVDFVKRSTGAGRLLTYGQRIYQVRGSSDGPSSCLIDQRSDHLYDASGDTTCTAANNTHCKRTDINYDHDEQGNVTVVYDYGDYFDSSDDTTSETFYNQNPAAYIMNAAAVQRLHPGIGTTAPMINETRTFYDGAEVLDRPPVAGLPTMTQEWVSSLGGANPDPVLVTRKKGYDPFGNVLWEEDALGGRTSFAYDGVYHQFLVRTNNALGQQTTGTWDPVCGRLLTETDLNGQPTTFQYDGFCRLTRREGSLGRFEAHVYGALGDAAAQFWRVERPPVAGVAGNVYQVSHFDGLDRVYRTQARGPDPAADDDILVDTTFDARGNVRTRSLPRYQGAAAVVTTFDHDELDRRIKATHADGNSISTGYHLWTSIETDETGKQVGRTVDARAKLVAVAEREGDAWNVARFSYDRRGNPLRTVDPVGNVTTYQYNSRGQKLTCVDPDLGTTSYAYDAEGRLLSETDGRGQRTELAYDPLGRVIGKQPGAEGGGPVTVTYRYDEPRAGFFNIGQMTTMTDPAGTATYDHDAAGRLVANTRSLAGVTHGFRQVFDGGDRLSGTRYPDGEVVGDDPGTAAVEPPLGYDGAGRLRSIPGLIQNVAYDAAGQVTEMVNPNGTFTRRAYSPTRAWLDSIRTFRGPLRLQELAYGRDSEGKVTAITSPVAGESWTYGYDPLGRLIRAARSSGAPEEQRFDYDQIGNVLLNSRLGLYTYAPPGGVRPHAVVAAGDLRFSYDAAGNMLEGNGRSHQWDGENRLVRVTAAGSVTTFRYDGHGARLEKNHNGAITRYLGSDYEIGPAGVVSKYFRLGGEVVAKKVGGHRFWLHANHIDSVQVVTDESGNEVRRENHRAYGESLDRSGAHEESFRFTGQRFDETGLLYLNARYYDPVIGRFLSPDTVTPGDLLIALNRYAYGNNDPINHTDPSGHFAWRKTFTTIGKIVVVGVAAGLATAACGPACGMLVGIAVGVAFDAGAAKAEGKEFGWDEFGSSVATNTAETLMGAGLGAGGGKVLGEAAEHATTRYGHIPQHSASRPPSSVTPHGPRAPQSAREVADNTTQAAAGTVAGGAAASGRQAAERAAHRAGERRSGRQAPRVATQAPDWSSYRAGERSSGRPTPPPSAAPPPASRARGGCFVAGTMVTMAGGGEKPIEQIRVGERVLAFDEATGRVLPAAVTQVLVHPDWRDQARTILINGRLRATENHPFFVNGGWVRAEHIRPGDLLRSLTAARPGLAPGWTTVSETVEPPQVLPGVDTVYNLEVDKYHTYFAGGVLVHNAIMKY